MNWMLSTINEIDYNSKQIYSIIQQICTNLLTAEVIKPAAKNENNHQQQQHNIFNVSILVQFLSSFFFIVFISAKHNL